MATSASASELLAAQKERILSVWEAEVRRTVPPAHAEERLALRNSLPLVVDSMISKLRSPDGGDSGAESKLAMGHGKHRAANPNYTIEQVIAEYHVLRRVLFTVLEEGGNPLRPQDRDLIWDVIFMAIKGAASEFQEVRNSESARLTAELDRANLDLRKALGERTAEVQLRGQLLDAIFERVTDYAIFSLDAGGHITTWSHGCELMKQYTKEDVIGHHYRMLYPEEGRNRREPEDHLRVAESEGRFRGEGLRQRKNGDLFLADVFITPMREDGKLVGFFKVVTDLTERNRVIQERDLSRTRVESLELQSELRERFIYTLTHDLKNPLSAAKMSIQGITRKGCDEPQHADLAQRAARNIGRSDEMIGNLLDASRIKAGQPMALHLEEYDLTEDVRATCDEMATVHGDRFVVNAPQSVTGVWDRNGLRRVLENLLSNAVKYGDPRMPVTTAIRVAADRVLLSVHNYGSPIDPREHETLFDLFRRTKSAVAGSKQGWGLGLTLVRGLTEAHGGVVLLTSLPSEGTRFVIDLPRDTRAANAKRELKP